MKKIDILVILSSPRTNSNSSFAALTLAKKFNKNFKIINVNKINIKPCKSCFYCSKTLKCCLKDDFEKVLYYLNKAKIIIIASPIYFTGVPGPLKIFIDRNQQQWEKFKTGYFKKIKKSGFIILTSGANISKYFAPAESEIKSFFAVNGIKCKKVFKFGNMDNAGEIKKEKYFKKLKV
jgi:multimeric flavodoxin WrbA